MLALPPIVKLNVGGTLFLTASSTLLNCPHEEQPTYFSQAFGAVTLPVDDGGAYFIDRDPTYFRHILNWLRTATCLQLSSESQHLELIAEAEYYLLSGFVRKLREHLPHPPVTVWSTKTFRKPEQKSSGSFLGSFPEDNYPRFVLGQWLATMSTKSGFELVSVHCDSMERCDSHIVVIYKVHK